jgi:LAO/AO transport system kinase
VVVVNPGWGDAIQANKAGLMEIADVFVINKADRPGGPQTRRDLELMLELSEPGGWRPPIVETVASTGEGVEGVWEAVGAHRRYLVEHDLLHRQRRHRLEREFRQIVLARVERQVRSMEGTGPLDGLVDEMESGRIDPYEAADRLLGAFGWSADGPTASS